MNKRQNISSEAEWEDHVGYSRAVRIGNTIEVSGTVSLKNGELFGKNDPYLQAKRCLEIITESVEKAGGSLNDIIRTRMFVTNISYWKEFGRAHGEVFQTIKPATTMVEVNRLIDSDYLIEIEATAIVL